MALNYTPEQQKCVDALIGPVDVSAGAGSGKTFTLTQRIANALVQPNSGVDSIDQVCAITFTEKAAAELKGRVRSTLRAEGLFDQAGKVDDAWISTIHGMCSRILHASALDLGLDPQFTVMGEGESAALLAKCVNDVLAEQKERGAQDYALLLDEFPFQSEMGASVSGLLTQIINAASGLPGGLDELIVCQRQDGPSALAKRLLLAYEELEVAYADLKPGKVNDAAQENIVRALGALRDFLASGSQDMDDLGFALDKCAVVRKCGGKTKADAADDYKAEHLAVLARFAMFRGGLLLDQLIALAKEVDRRFRSAKRDLAQLDNNDLICETLRALDLPQVHDRYADKFRLVMVDEFQDTDSMQIAIIKHLCGPHMRYLCTVGDAQQSIYGFRGADIAVYRAHQASLEDPGLKAVANPTPLKLSKNFRSHKDVLAFVKCVCSQDSVFGDGFLDLEDSYDGSNYKCADPRIQLDLVLVPPSQKLAKVEVQRQLQAQRIAEFFARMHDGGKGHQLSDMVLLLGATTHADQYAQAVRDQGFDCIIAGGSLFARAPEVQSVASLLGAIVNPLDGQLAFQALSSPAFALGADDLLTLATFTDEETGQPGKRPLDDGLRTLARLKAEGEGQELSPALASAVQVMAKASRALRKKPLSQVLLEAMLDSGWIARLQARGAEGAAQLGNLMKAVRMVEQIEENSTFGPVSVMRQFRAQIAAGMKEAPGALNAEGQNAVRIMTIHASKGLEFPVVAMAEFDRDPKDDALAIRRVDGRTYASLKPGKRMVDGKESKEGDALKAEKTRIDLLMDGADITADDLADADAVDFRSMLMVAANQADRKEAQRLFYVGATRAVEALGVFMTVKESSTNPNGPYQGLIGNIRSALFGANPFPEESVAVDYGGTAPADFRVTLVNDAFVSEMHQGETEPQEAAAKAAAAAANEPNQLLIPQVMPLRTVDARLEEQEDSGLFSYSSIASYAHAKGDDAVFGAVDEPLAKPGSAAPEPAPALSEAALRRIAAAPSIVQEEEEGEVPDRFAKERTADSDKATGFGSALHRLCQMAALVGADQARSRVPQMCVTYGVEDQARLQAAVERWLASKTCAQAFAHDRVLPEVSFNLQVGDGSEAAAAAAGVAADAAAGADAATDAAAAPVLQGEIDLLCTDAPKDGSLGSALVVDYKTGGKPEETDAQLQKKHALQAQCYALVVLSWGYEDVELVFARVEQDDPAGADTLQTIRFSYDQNDVEKLRQLVRDQAARAGRV